MHEVGTNYGPIRVLNIAETIKGGVATYLAGLEKGRDTLACEFAHLVPATHASELQAPRIFTHDGSRSPLGLLRLVRRAVLVQREYRAHVVYAHSTFAGVALCLMRPFLGADVKTLYCPHGWAMFREMKSWKRFLVELIERAMSFVPSIVVNISSFEHGVTRGRGFSSHCVLIPNAVVDASDYRLLDSDESRPVRVLYVGRFDRQKGVDVLIDALLGMGESSLGRFEFDLVGSGVLDDGDDLLRRLPVNVKHHGWLAAHAVHELYKAADILVMPSRWEGFGLCAVEAFRAGTPVLARRVGALPEIVSNGVNGYLFEGDSEELADALMRLNLTELRAMRWAAREAFESRYRIERLHRQYRDLFVELMQDADGDGNHAGK